MVRDDPGGGQRLQRSSVTGGHSKMTADFFSLSDQCGWSVYYMPGPALRAERPCPQGRCPRAVWLTHIKMLSTGTSPVAQWLRIHLPMQGTRVWSLVREDPTCRRATKPASHNYWARVPRACAPQQEKPPKWEACALQRRLAPRSPLLEKACVQQQKPNAAKNNNK